MAGLKRRGSCTPRPDRSAEFASYTPRPRAVAVAVAGPARASVPIPKRAYVRSEALRVACRAIPCQHCGAQDGTVCAAHANWAAYGKGGAIKADDSAVAALCWRCHAVLDQGKRMSKVERQGMWQAAHEKTVDLLKGLGRWPEGAE